MTPCELSSANCSSALGLVLGPRFSTNDRVRCLFHQLPSSRPFSLKGSDHFTVVLPCTPLTDLKHASLSQPMLVLPQGSIGLVCFAFFCLHCVSVQLSVLSAMHCESAALHVSSLGNSSLLQLPSPLTASQACPTPSPVCCAPLSKFTMLSVVTCFFLHLECGLCFRYAELAKSPHVSYLLHTRLLHRQAPSNFTVLTIG